MANDTSLQQVFKYPGVSIGNGDASTLTTVYATFVEHFANSHPPEGEAADLVTYAGGPMTVAKDKSVLSAELRVWRNITNQGQSVPGGGVVHAPDAFDDPSAKMTVLISVSESGAATYQKRLNGKPIGGMPPVPLKAKYQSGLFVENTPGIVRSLSFTLA